MQVITDFKFQSIKKTQILHLAQEQTPSLLH